MRLTNANITNFNQYEKEYDNKVQDTFYQNVRRKELTARLMYDHPDTKGTINRTHGNCPESCFIIIYV
jgi:hypothetical protein